MKKIIGKIILRLTKRHQEPKTITVINSNYVMAKCGHQTIKKDILMDLGNKIPFGKAPFIPQIDYCDSCLLKMAIICPKCRKLIIIGDEVDLYSPKLENLKISSKLTFYKGSLISCKNCGLGGTYAKWVAPGKFLKRPSL